MSALDRVSLLQGVEVLAARDARLGRLVAQYGPPPLWARPRGFATLLRIILEQQVSLASARALYQRLASTVTRVAPETVAALGFPGLRAIGFTRQKASYTCSLADWVLDGRLPLDRLGRYPDGEASERLRQVPGIGPWTAAIYLLMALRRPDIWPPGDLALHQAVGRLTGTRVIPTTRQVEELAARWRPLRAVAARILWHGYLAQRAAARGSESRLRFSTR